MNKVIHSILLSALTMSAAQAQLHSNHTYLRARDSLSNNAAMNLTGNTYGCRKKIGSTVSVSGFYRKSHNQSDMAAYFGGGQAVNSDQNGTIVATAAQTTDEGRANHLSGYAIQHGSDPSGTLTLKPERTEYGVHINWKHDLGKVYQGLSLFIDAPIVHAKTTMGATANDATMTSYFAGTLSSTAAATSQAALSHLRMDNVKRSKTELADINVGLNYRVRTGGPGRISVRGGLTLPTGTKHNGVEAFQPQVGNGGHVALGGGVRYMNNLWKSANNCHRVNFLADADYRYLFSSHQTRTLGLYNHWYKRLATAGHYRNLGKAGGAQAVPAANALTRSMTVTPGSQFSGIASLKYHFKNFSFTAGYNLYARDKETVEVGNANQWFDGEYGMLLDAVDVSDPAGDASEAIIIGSNNSTVGGPIQKQGNTTTTVDSAGAALGSANAAQYYVTTDACASPSSVTHKLFGAAQYKCTCLRVPFSVSAGGEYEFADKQNNRGINSWAAWAKVSMCF